MASAARITKISSVIAVVGTAAVLALLSASFLGMWMENAYRHPTPRINSLTVGCGLVPVPVVAWIVYLWVRVRPSGFAGVATLIIVSLGLLLMACYCIFVAMVSAWFVG